MILGLTRADNLTGEAPILHRHSNRGLGHHQGLHSVIIAGDPGGYRQLSLHIALSALGRPFMRKDDGSFARFGDFLGRFGKKPFH